MKRKLAKQQTKTVIILVNAQHITINKRTNYKRNVKQIMTGTMFMSDERQGATFKHQLLTNRMRNSVKNCCETDTIESISSLNLDILQYEWELDLLILCSAQNHVYYAKPTFTPVFLCYDDKI